MNLILLHRAPPILQGAPIHTIFFKLAHLIYQILKIEEHEVAVNVVGDPNAPLPHLLPSLSALESLLFGLFWELKI
jgi:hypothetical protein